MDHDEIAPEPSHLDLQQVSFQLWSCLALSGFLSGLTDSSFFLFKSYDHEAFIVLCLQLAKLCPIDLVIGGPPCNDLSIVNPLRKGFSK